MFAGVDWHRKHQDEMLRLAVAIALVLNGKLAGDAGIRLRLCA